MSFITFFIIFCVSTAHAKCPTEKTIVFGGLDWDSSRFHVATARFLLEEGYGCKTDVIPGTTLPLLTALGRGDVDVLMEIWRQNITEAWTKLQREKKVVDLGVNFPDAVQGFYVPTYVIEGDPERGIKPLAPDLKTVDQLGRYKNLFTDPEKPSKGRFHNCILGWSCESVNTKKLKVYGLDKDFTNFRPGTGAALAAAYASMYKRGKPFVGYYWGPTWLLGKFDFTMLEESPYNESIWKKLVSEENPQKATAYPTVEVSIGANKSFADQNPALVALFQNYSTSSALVSQALAYMEEKKNRAPRDAAIHFLKTNQSLWKDWLPAENRRQILKALGEKEASAIRSSLWIEKSINDGVNQLVKNHTEFFEELSNPLRELILFVEKALIWPPWWVLSLIFSFLAWAFQKKKRIFITVFTCFGLIHFLGHWDLSMQTLALMFISTLLSLIIGVPTGIIISMKNRIRSFFLPILDAMQTMPSFVYLIPALMLFGLGKVPAVFATVIYAVAPIIRLTDHGIRTIDFEIIEAARSFGASRKQMLINVQLPLALPTIMAGVNQTTMLALSMVVVASMIGARGLGEQVLLGIQKLDVGQGFTAGCAIVLLAIAMDRISQALGHSLDKTR